MFTTFFHELKAAGLPVTLREYLTLMEAMEADIAGRRVEDFYYLSRAALVKDERNLDKFDRVFGHVFQGLDLLADAATAQIPAEWLKRLAEKYLTEEEMKKIEALGWEKLMETIAKRLAEQEGRHQGGSKWIGTAGTSPFGAYGYNPEGIRIGQEDGRNRSAIKVWDERTFRNLDDSVELNTRNIKIALRRRRPFAREGVPEALDLGATIDRAAKNAGWLDLHLVPERRNRVKVLLFLDVGGSMDPHVQICEELFSAAKSEFRHLEYFYFHNCVYDYVWRDNRRRRNERFATFDILHKYGPDWRLVLVGDAAMSPYEIVHVGGSIEYMNDEAGAAAPKARDGNLRTR